MVTGGLLEKPLSVSCPFSFEVPQDMLVHIVPEHLRSDISRLKAQRAAFNSSPTPLAERQAIEQWRESRRVEEALERAENELRSMVGAPRESYVDYFARWNFRCADAQTLKAEYLARCEKK